MDKKSQLNRAESKIASALGDFLRTRQAATPTDSDSSHLDDDMLSAFVEGNLSETEATPVVSHLADCSFCLRVSAELVRLDAQFADETPVIPAVTEGNQGIGEMLEGFLARIFGPEKGAVFAHEEKPDSEDEEGKQEES